MLFNLREKIAQIIQNGTGVHRSYWRVAVMADEIIATFKMDYRERIKRLYPCRYPQIHASDGRPNGCPDCCS